MNETLKSYTRAESRNGYTIITDVDSAGNYYQRAVRPGGIVTGSFCGTLAAIGWASLAEFLAHRTGFVLTGC